MTVRENPVKRIMAVRKIDGRLVLDMQGTVRVPIKLKLRNISCLLCRNRPSSPVIPIEAA
jgi:hypothetical protein